MATTIRYTFTPTEPQKDYLKSEAERLGVSVSEVIRRIIDRHREEHPPRPSKQGGGARGARAAPYAAEREERR